MENETNTVIKKTRITELIEAELEFIKNELSFIEEEVDSIFLRKKSLLKD